MSSGDALQSAVKTAAISNLLYIVLVLVCIGLAWYGLQQFKFELFLRKPRGAAARLLQVFLSIGIGYQVARFVMDYMSWSLGWSGLGRLLQG